MSALSIPQRPRLASDGSDAEFVAAVHRVAVALAHPLVEGAADFSDWDFVDTIGREKLWLAALSRAHLPLNVVQRWHGFLSWCATYGVLGTWRQTPITTHSAYPHVQEHWENYSLVHYLYNEQNLLWNPVLTTTPPVACRVEDLFVPADKFRYALDQILIWHEKRSPANHPTKNPFGELLQKKAQEAALFTPLPKSVWVRIFETHFLGKPHTRPPAGISKRNVTAFHKAVTEYINVSTSVFTLELPSFFFAESWHPLFHVKGPSMKILQDAWARRWGQPWIRCEDEWLEQIPRSMYPQLAQLIFAHIQDGNEVSACSWQDRLPVLTCLAQVVSPGTPAARAVADQIEAGIAVASNNNSNFACELNLLEYLRSDTSRRFPSP